MNQIFHLSSAEARRMWECLMDPPAVHLLWGHLATLLCDLFNVERANLFLVIPEKEQLRSRAASRFQWDIVLPWHDGVAGQVYQTREPLSINDIPASSFGHFFNRAKNHFQTRSMLTVPIFHDGDDSQSIVAIIQLVNKIDADFTEQDLQALKYWSRQIGVGLERAHGMEIWRHPESALAYLENPSLVPFASSNEIKKIRAVLPKLTYLAMNEMGCSHQQATNLQRVRSLAEGKEMIKIVRDRYRHDRLLHQMSSDEYCEDALIKKQHRFWLRWARLVNRVMHNRHLCHLINAYEEWLGFYISQFVLSMSEEQPKQHNRFSTMVEDKRSHSMFYEMLLLDSFALSDHSNQTGHLWQRLVRFFYGRMAQRFLMQIGCLNHQQDFPSRFRQAFLGFSDRRIEDLHERIQVRQLKSPSLLRRFFGICRSSISLASHAVVALFVLPIALLKTEQKKDAADSVVISAMQPTHSS